MTHKEIAERLRGIAEREGVPYRQTIRGLNAIELANELDPPKPERGSVVWWSCWDGPWTIGLMHMDGSDIIVRDDGSHVNIDEVKWKPARICAPDEVPVKILPVSEWPQDASELALVFWDSFYRDDPDSEPEWRIARDEAERMEAER